MNAEILAVGTELLLGDILNTNAQYLSRELAALGINVMHQSVVGDNPQRLSKAMREALERSDIVITTGGLGPTGDDITREVVSETMGLRLMLDIRSLQRIQEFFNRTGREMTDNNQKQAMLPEGSTVFQNDWGTAPACAVQKDGKTVVMLPGPPREMTPIFETYVKPYLAKFSDSVIFSLSLRVFGIGESAVEDRLSDLMQGSNPTLAPYAKDGEVLLRITARAKTKELAESLCVPVRDEIISRLGDYVYGENVDSLQQVVVKKLAEKNLKIGLAESCTGGYLAKRITEIPGSSEVFDCGIVSYANSIKENKLGVQHSTLEKYGAVSEQTAIEMAEGARLASGADIGVGITGIAGPGGDTAEKPIGLVYTAVSNGKICFVKRLSLGRSSKEREYIRYAASSHALDMVRRLIDNIEQSEECVQMRIPEHFEKLEKSRQFAGASLIKPKKTFKTRFHSFIRNTFPMKGDSKKQVIFKLLFIAAVIAFIISMVQIVSYVSDYLYTLIRTNQISDDYNPNNTSTDKSNGFYKLLKQNPDTKGFIIVPGTHINYPVVESTDNNYYLRRNFDRKSDRHGVPFIDFRSSVKPMSKNIIIYGHNMQDALMFHDLTKYKDLDFYKTAPVITFNTIEGNHKWKVFAAFITNADAKAGPVFDYLVPSFKSNDDFNNYITQVRRRSLLNTSVDVNENDTILTLSTCTYEFTDARFVVEARLLRPGEDSAVGAATVNSAPLMPDIWYTKYGGTKPVFANSTSIIGVPASSSSAVSKQTSSVKSSSQAKLKPLASSSKSSKTHKTSNTGTSSEKQTSENHQTSTSNNTSVSQGNPDTQPENTDSAVSEPVISTPDANSETDPGVSE